MQGVRALQKYGEKPMRACVLYKMHVGGVGVVLFVRVLTGLLRTGMSVSLCLADSSHEVCVYCACCPLPLRWLYRRQQQRRRR
jgi:hypothetical protein